MSLLVGGAARVAAPPKARAGSWDGRFRIEHAPVLARPKRSLNAHHVLISGDLTTTAVPAKFRAARAALSDWLADSDSGAITP